jgi:penicillin-binding protein 1A
MAGAFATFANAGVYTKPYCVSKIVDARGNIIYEAAPLQRRVMSEQAAYLLTDMLVSAVSGGTGTNARLKDWPTAGKTGTVELPSEDTDYAGKSGHKDVWFAGYTPELCGVVWMGYDNKFDADKNLQYLPRVYGGGPPAKLWQAVMTACHEGLEVQEFRKPGGLTAITIDTKSGALPSALTPSEFRGSEMYDARFVPTEESDVWQVVELCADSEVLAGEFCPNKVAAVRLVLELPEGQERSPKVADYALYAPQNHCSMHTMPQGNLVSVYICTDPRHGTERVRANIPSLGEGGGCPQEFIALRYYGEAYLPARHCELAEHALEASAGAYNPFLPPGLGGGNNTVGGNDFNPAVDPGLGRPILNGYPTDETGAPILQTPYDLTVVPYGAGCQLSWAAFNDPATTIYIIQKTTDNDPATEIRYQVNGAYSFEDAEVLPGHVYSYRVYAYNAEYNVISNAWSQKVSFSL